MNSGYENGAGSSSAKEKETFRKGSLDAMASDMYDKMPTFEKKEVSKPMDTNFQNGQNSANKTQAMPDKKNDGKKDYGKGNPYKAKSIADLRKLSK